MAADDWFDARVAGWWVWGINSWIGSGWCAGGPWTLLGDGDQASSPLGTPGGASTASATLGDAGQGINRKLPSGTPGGAHHPRATSLRWIRCARRQLGQPLAPTCPMYGYLMALADRLRKVRVCCGDWSRVVTNGALNYGATVGVFLDPPYLGDVRADLYATRRPHDRPRVRDWCLANGDNPRYRIVLAGYSDEHDH